MRRPRRARLSLALLFALGVTQAWARDEATARPRRAPAGPRFESPFKPGLKPLADGPVLRIRGSEFLDAKAYRDISAAAQHLLTLYPANRHYFIGLGRDPAPIIAFLQNLGGKQLAINFPASSNEGDKATVRVLARYVKRLVPPEILKSGRTIVFVDATSSGRALDHYVPLIKPSLKGAKVIKAAFGVDYSLQGQSRIFRNPGDKQVISTAAFPEVNRFYSSPYEDAIAEYRRHGPGTHSMNAIKTSRRAYLRFRGALLKRMQRDEGLHAFLTTEAGPAFRVDSKRR